MPSQTFNFAFTPVYRALALPFGVTPTRSTVSVSATDLIVRYGPWRVETVRSNIADVEMTGPYHLVKTAGPARLSFADRGLTFASNAERGVCITFLEPIVGADPRGMIRSPNLTLTVEDCAALLETLARTG
jgi:hypothetical protein